VTQFVYEVPKHLKSSLLLHLLKEPQMNMVLIFVRMKHAPITLRTIWTIGD